MGLNVHRVLHRFPSFSCRAELQASIHGCVLVANFLRDCVLVGLHRRRLKPVIQSRMFPRAGFPPVALALALRGVGNRMFWLARCQAVRCSAVAVGHSLCQLPFPLAVRPNVTGFTAWSAFTTTATTTTLPLCLSPPSSSTTTLYWRLQHRPTLHPAFYHRRHRPQ